MTDPNAKPHDHFVRRALSHPPVSRAFFAQHLPPPLLNSIDLDQMELTDDSFIDRHLREHVSDMVFRVPMKARQVFIYLLLEHKSQTVDDLPALMEKYRLEAMFHYRRAKGRRKYPLVVPMVLYHGETPYTGARRFKDCIDAPATLVEQAFHASFGLIDLSQYSDDELKQNVWTGVFQLVLKHIRNPDILRHLAPLLPLMQRIEREGGGLEFLETVFRYLFTAARVENIDEMARVAVKSLSQETEEAVMTIAEQLEKRGWEKGRLDGREEGRQAGREEGRQAGREEGREENSQEVALRLIDEGMSLEFVAKVTLLPLDRLRTLKKNGAFRGA